MTGLPGLYLVLQNYANYCAQEIKLVASHFISLGSASIMDDSYNNVVLTVLTENYIQPQSYLLHMNLLGSGSHSPFSMHVAELARSNDYQSRIEDS